ncbi:unnamed protein product, partial [Symbiodinium necroappetens]
VGALDAAQLFGDAIGSEDMPDEPLPHPNVGRDGSQELGLQIWAPHYQVTYASVLVPDGDSGDTIIAKAAEHASQAFHHDFTSVAPVKAMPHAGFATFVAIPDCLDAADRVVVLLDFGMIAGQRFSCVLPAQLSYRDMIDFVAPIAGKDRGQTEVFIDLDQVPHQRGVASLIDAPPAPDPLPGYEAVLSCTLLSVGGLCKLACDASAGWQSDDIASAPFVPIKISCISEWFFACKGPSAPTASAGQAEVEAHQQNLLQTAPAEGPQPYQAPEQTFTAPQPEVAVQDEPVPYRSWKFLVLGPNISKEYVDLQLRVPCTVQRALEEVSEARNDNRQWLYGLLAPVTPQPADDFATLIALPTWASSKTAVCMDTRLCDGRIFCIVLPGRFNRESLLRIAGIADLQGVEVYCGDSWVPLRAGELIDPPHGTLITFVPHTQLYRPGFSLQQMLLRHAGGNTQPEMPTGNIGRFFWILTDAWPVLFDARHATRDTFQAALAVELRTVIGALAVQTPKPMIGDYDHNGRHCEKVIVATEQICRVPVPPGRRIPPTDICVLDLRPILKGLRWLLVHKRKIHLEPLVTELSDGAPDGFRVNIAGGSIEHTTHGTYIQVAPGQALIAHFLRDAPPSEAGSDAFHSSWDSGLGGDTDSDDSDQDMGHDDDTQVVDAAQGHQEGGEQADPEPTQDYGTPNDEVQPHQHGHDDVTKPLAWALYAWCLRALGLCLCLLIVCCWQAKGLQEPQPDSLQSMSRLDDPRQVTRRFGHPWPHLHWTGAPQESLEIDRESSDTSASFHSFVATLFVFRVAYQPERFFIHVDNPEHVEQLEVTVNTIRDPEAREDFPVLIQAYPQPHREWGALLALPWWDSAAHLVLLDLLRIDGRILAACVPDIISRDDLLQQAGLDPTSDAQIFLGDTEAPLEHDRVVQVPTGTCITFVPGYGVPPPVFTLREMLRNAFGWAEHEVELRVQAGISYLLVSFRGTFLHFPDLGSPMHVRDEIAATIGCRCFWAILDARALQIGFPVGLRFSYQLYRTRLAIYTLSQEPAINGEGAHRSRCAPLPDLKLGTFANDDGDTSLGFDQVAFSASEDLAISPPTEEELEDFEVLSTLLEDSVRQPESRAFFLAATLVETLSEHFQSEAQARQYATTAVVVADGGRQTLSLESALPLRPEESKFYTGSIQAATLDCLPALRSLPSDDAAKFGGTDLGFTWGQLVEFLTIQPRFETWEAFFGEEDVIPHADPPSLHVAMSRLAQTTADRLLCCYTDGSFFPARANAPPKAGWSVIFVDPHQGTFAISAGPLLEPLLGQGVQISPYQAECCALAVAATTSVLSFADRPIRFLSDCTAALGAAQGQCGYATGGLPEALAAAFDLRQRGCNQTDQFAYVPGHQGDFFNEAADMLAKWGAKQDGGGSYQQGAMATLQAWLQKGARCLPWVTLVIQQLRGYAELPPLGCLNLGCDTWHAGLADQQLVCPFLPPGVGEEAKEDDSYDRYKLSLRLLSYSTLSLGGCLEYEDGQGQDVSGRHSRPGRAALLAKQLDDHKVTCAFLQETRCPAGTSTVGGYLRYSAGALKGQWGTEIWLRKGAAFLLHGSDHQRSLLCDSSNVANVHADPRRMLLRISGLKFSVLLCALHAPQRATEAHAVERWWSETLALLRQHRRQSLVIVAGDVNCAVGSVVSAEIGDCGAEEEDEPGTKWRALLKELDCIAPCTFPAYQIGQPDANQEDLDLSSLPDGDVAAILQHMQEPTAFREAGASEWQEQLANKLTESTWFLMQGDHTPVLTSRGTRPGSTAADLLFAMVVQKILRRRDALCQGLPDAPVVPSVPWDSVLSLEPPSDGAPSVPLDDLIWADDISCMRISSSPHRLPSNIGCTAGVLSDAFNEFGFKLTFGPTKTAALAQAIGVKHSCRGGMCAELRYRAAQARTAFQEGRRKVYRVLRIPLKRRAFILTSTVLPKLLFGAGSWPPLNQKEYSIVSGALWTFYRALLGVKSHENQSWAAHTVLALTGLSGPQVTLYCARLHYLCQLCRSAPPALWALVKLDRPYAESLQTALAWLYKWTYATSPLPNPLEQWPPWLKLATDTPNKFKGLVLRAQGLESCKSQVIAAYDGLHKALQCWIPCHAPPDEIEKVSGCGKTYGNVGFSTAEAEVHPQAPPVKVIEPVQTLRDTVKAWRDSEPEDLLVTEAANDLLLLLDPELLADSVQPAPQQRQFPADTEPFWTDMPNIGMPAAGDMIHFQLESPPPRALSPFGATSMRLREAKAFADWAEQACAMIVQCLVNAQGRPFQVRCPGIAAGLGPAAQWLRAVGIAIDDQGLTLAL